MVTLAIFFNPRSPGPPMLPMVLRKRRDDKDEEDAVIDVA